MRRKKIVDVRDYNSRKHQEWQFAQKHYPEWNWLSEHFQTDAVGKEIRVKSKFKNFYGDWIEFKIGMNKNYKLLLHDDGFYLNELEASRFDIYLEIKKQFTENHSMLVTEIRNGFILKETGCTENELPLFLFEIQKYCLALTHLVGLVIRVDQTS